MEKATAESLDDLLGKARNGDRAAFSQIVRTLMNQVAALTYRMIGEREAAKDLAQETFVSAWEHLDSFRGDAAVHSWIYRIAVNKCLNYLKLVKVRESSSSGSTEPDAQIASENPERDLERQELSTGFRAFTAQLPPQQRAIFELRFYQSMSFEEIAEKLIQP